MSSPSDRAKPQRHFKHVLCGGENLRIDLAKRLAPMGDKAWNLYGPTETTIWSSATQITGDENQITIGTPIHNTQLYICDEDLNLVPPGVTGQILIGGQGLARGYRNQPGQTADRFVPNPFSRIPGDRLYRTGDLGRYRPDGNIVWLGRVDQQVKIRGYRIELEEVERALCEYGSVADAAVVAKGDPSGGSYLAAIMITRPDTLQPSRDDLRQHLLKHLPEYMLPSEYVFVDHMPLTASGKVDRQALRKLDTVYHAAEINRHPDGPAVPIDDGVDNGGGIGDMEELVAHVWREVLGLESVGLDVNFFDVGGHSLRLAQVRSNLESRLHRDIPMIDLFRYPTVRSSAAFLLAHAAPPIDQARRAADPSRQGDAEAASVISNQRAVDHSIAIVGLAGRFPGADSAEQFWDNLGQGVESIRSFGSQSDDVSTLSRDAHHVRAGGVLDDIEAFDAGYFGYSPREASLMDPQHRLFLETAVQALENAGYGDASGRRIAVFAGCSLNTYLLELIKQTDLMEAAGLYAMLVGSDKDFVSTRVSYKLGLRGPAMTVQTACSTSLVAVHLACQSLLNNECEMALAGAASIRVPQTVGYRYEEGGVLSPDGHCRAFDAQAQGTVPGSGVGVVVLKRLDAAMADGDFIHAVIKGSAINNDGANKVSYTAPSVEGQAQVIAEAMTKAGVTADSIGYVEAHGTGTALGDPIEIAALTEAYRHQTDKTGFCRIGSVKTNIGHLDTASGIASLIKTIGIMRRGTIPASLNYVSPNPTIPFETTPFVVNDREMAWPDEARPMRAAVSNFGIGGTNVHIVLEEPPVSQQGALSDKAQTQIQLPVSEQAQWHVVPISAKTPEALDAAISQLAVHLESHNDSSQLKEPLQIEHIAFTYQIGRKSWNHRRAIVCRDKDELLSSLVSSLSGKMIEGDAGKCPAHAEVVFLFPGFGMQYLEMGHGLYQQFTTYRDAVNRCVGAAQPYFSFDIRMALMPRLDGDMSSNKAAEAAADTPLGQLAVFVAEYALAQLWMSLGIKPTALAGHSLGEYVAACIAGVFSLEDAIMLVIKRAELMARTPAGLMLSVALGDAEIQPLVKDTSLSLALVNAPNLCVVAGSHDDVAEFESRLKQMGKAATRLKVAHAYHSSMMDGILDPYREIVNKVTLHPPKVPIMSSHSGAWMTAEEATRREYWVRHARETIRFADAIHTLVSSKAGVMIEVGPGKGMSALVQGQVRRLQKQAAWRVTPSLTSVAGPEEGRNFLEALAQVWAMGMDVDWNGLGRREGVRRIPLPTYPFQRQRYWLAAPSGSSSDLPTVPNAKTAMPDERHTEQRPEHQSDKPVRQTVQAILREILGVADFDGQASFLELGGHSLLAIQVVSRIRDVLRCKLSVRDLLTCATLNDLVQLVEKVMAVDNHTDAIQPVPRDSSTASLPLSVAEQRLHFLEKLENGLATYNVPIAIELTGTLNRFALERALDDLVVRHEILRTTYQDSATGAYRVIADSQAARFNLGWIDLSPLDEDTRQHELRRILVEHANQPFVLANGPLARAQLVCLAENAHVFAMTLHHIIADGWSVNIMVREIVQLYYAQVLGQPTHLPSLSVQYADYAVWQKEYMADPAIESAMQVQLTYWRHELAGSTNLLALPTDRPRPHVQRHVGAKRNFVLPLQLSKALANFAQSRGMTLYMVMLAGFQAVLHRYTGQDDICIGSPVAGRSHPQLENLIGLFLNTLVLRAKFDNDQSFDDLLAQVKEKVVGALDHQDVPFERVVDALQPNRDLGHTPLFQAMFISQSQPRWPMYPGELSLRTIPADGGGSKFDLTMSFSEDDEALHGEIEYDTDLFNPDTIERLIEHYIRLLDEAIAAPHQRINEIPLIDRAEQKHLRRLGCVPAQATITEMGPFTHEWFTKVAEVEPDRIALTQAGVHVTYHDLNVLANRLAHYLISLGVGTETPVGICLRPGVDLVVGLLGILKAGAAFVPLDPDYPADRLNYMLDTAAATYLLTNSQLADRLSSSVATTICLDVDQINIERFPGEAPNLQIDQHHLAYIIYTSGSTGKPKGVQISHGALVQFLRAMPDELGLTRDDVVAGITTLSFDPSLLELFGFLTRGARVALIDHLERQDGHALRKRLVEQQVTVLQATPSMWQLLIDAGWQGESLKLALVGGERLTESLAAKLLQHGVEVWNIYGPTETTVWSSIGRVSVADLSGRITIGKPMGAMRYFILDEALNPVPIGVVGEIYIAGPGLGRGYQARPDLTAERYIPNPFSDTAGQRMYRTGDLARFGADGRIEFIGRLDHQIKIRGFRVELGEIEASLRRNADIKEAIVTVREDVLGDKRLVGYVIFDPAAFSSDSDAIARERRLTEIRSELNLMLPDYMVPTSILCLMQWPLTPNGKVDRSQLPEPPRERAGTETTFVMPHTENERRIATVFSKLLRVDRISRLDSFFDLGGHSLLVAQLAAELGSIYGVELSLKDIFLSPTVSGMASHIETLIARHDSAAMTEDERLQRLIDSLTDEEVDQLLSMHVRETSEPEVISL
jgi:amino acid adenylation domain-containing protein